MDTIISHQLFALGFGASAMLWGMGLASAPVILHLLFRRRYREIDWAAMKWLIDAMRKNYRRLRLEQLLLLAVRTLLIVLVVLAMAKPAFDSAVPALLSAKTSAVHHVIVFDNSMSMHYRAANQSRWEQAKGMAQQILDGAQMGDLASVVVMGSSPVALVGEPSPYLTTVGEEIESIRADHGPASLDGAVDLTANIVRDSPAATKRVYLITDMQRSTWVSREEGTNEARDLGRKLKAISDAARFDVIDVGDEQSPNLAVSSVEQITPVAVLQRPVTLRASIANHSNKAVSDVEVELVVDDQIETRDTVSLPPGESQSLAFAVTPVKSGFRVCEVRLADDSLRLDNKRWQILNVRRSVRVLVVDGEPSGEPFRSETDYLKVALSPGDEIGRPALIETEVRMESDLLESGLNDYDVVILCNVGQFTRSEAEVVERFVAQGGGAIFFAGSQTNIPAFNEVLYADGNGLLPARLMDVVGSQDQSDSFFTVDPLDYQHPIVTPFRDHEEAGLLTTKVFRYLSSSPTDDPDTKVALGLSDGSPLLVTGSYGRGRVALITTSADLDWNTWAVSPSFVPIVNELVLNLVAGKARSEGLLAGETISFPAPGGSLDVVMAVAAPEQATAPTSIRAETLKGTPTMTFSETQVAGVYGFSESRVAPDRLVAVNTWPAESALSKLVESDLRSMFPGWEFTLSDRLVNQTPFGGTGAESEASLHRLLLYMALVCAFAETLMAWRFGNRG